MHCRVELAKERLLEISGDPSTYVTRCEQLLAEKHFPTIGDAYDAHTVHSTVVQPYISKLVKNIDNRFGDTVGRLSIAANIFHPAVVIAQSIFKSLLTTDIGDSYPVLTQLAAITLACPLGTAGMLVQYSSVQLLRVFHAVL